MNIAQKSFTSGPGRLGGPLLIAIALEALGIAILTLHMAHKAPETVAPKVIKIHMIAPKPVAPPKIPEIPQPTMPQMVPVPVPLPPPPHLVPHPRFIRHVELPHHVVQPVVSKPPLQPVESKPIPAAPLVSAAQVESLMARYVEEIRTNVDANLQVPAQLVALDMSGTCILEFTIAPDGKLLSSRVLTSSGIAMVDHAALEALRSSSFSPFLKGMGTSPHTFTMPVKVSGDGG